MLVDEGPPSGDNSDEVIAVGWSCGRGMKPGRCANCGGVAPAKRRCCSAECNRAWAAEHVWGAAKIVALAEAGYACEECGALDWDTVLDVHHIEPVEPVVGYRAGCQHHQANLAVLCRLHHLAIHNALRAQPGEQLMLPVRAA